MNALALNLSQRFRWAQLPVVLLVTLLQRTPVVRFLAAAESVWVGSSLGEVLRSTAAIALTLGAVDTLAGATTMTANPASPASATVGTNFSAAFAVTGAPSVVKSYSVTNLPPGLTVPGATLNAAGALILNSSTGTITGIPTTAGSYVAVITAWELLNAAGNKKAYNYTINVTGAAATAPSITTQPAAQSATAGGSVSFSVAASGTSPFTYQWRKDGVNIAGATASSYSIASVAAGDAGTYSVVVSNSAGSATSNGAALTVTAAPSGSTTIFPHITGLVFGGSNRLYACDSANSTIHTVALDGTVNLLAGSRGNVGSTDGYGNLALFSQPGGVTATSTGTVYVADTANATIRRIATDGAVTTFAGSAFSRGNTDGSGSAATFSAPTGLALDKSGNLYVADATNHTIRKITSNGAVTTFAGKAGVSGTTDGTGANARFNHPTGLAVDDNGNLYVADTTNDTIRKITSSGSVTTFAGLPGVSGADNGTGQFALFNQPQGLAFDDQGNLFVADTGNSTIRKITPAGAVSTFAGVPGVSGTDNGTGQDALFNHPLAITVDGSDNLYVADTGSSTIRKITPSRAVTTLSLTQGTDPAPVGNSGSSTSGSTDRSSDKESSSGGGGAPSLWFPAGLALLWGLRRFNRRSAAGAFNP